MNEQNLASNLPSRSWRVIDLVIAAVLAVVLGVGMWAYDTFAYAPVGLLLGILGNVMGTYLGLITSQLCRWVGGQSL